MGTCRRFTQDEVDWLREYSEEYTIREMAAHLDRATPTVHAKLGALGLKSKGWTDNPTSVKEILDRLFRGSEWERKYDVMANHGWMVRHDHA